MHRHCDVNSGPWSWATWTLLGPEVFITKKNQACGPGWLSFSPWLCGQTSSWKHHSSKPRAHACGRHVHPGHQQEGWPGGHICKTCHPLPLLHSQSSLGTCARRLAVSCGGQDARQGWGCLSAEQGRSLGRQSQQRRPGCREPELVCKENQEGD